MKSTSAGRKKRPKIGRKFLDAENFMVLSMDWFLGENLKTETRVFTCFYHQRNLGLSG
jgi:hypothetical protein